MKRWLFGTYQEAVKDGRGDGDVADQIYELINSYYR